jgi:hypothetical protein
MLILESGYTESQIESGIRRAVSTSSAVGTHRITSDKIIPIIQGRRHFIQDYGVPACNSDNAKLGRDIRVVGEHYGIIQKDKQISKKINGSRTTITRYNFI